MARKKVILRDQILDAAYHIVRSCGFHRLTARHIANDMKCSTQPIYLEFENMVDLKRQVYHRIEKELQSWLVRKEPYDSDPLISLCFGYMEFANVETSLYRTLSVDDCAIHLQFQSFICHNFYEAMEKEEQYRVLSEEKKQALISQLWILATGLASASASHLLIQDKKDAVHDFLAQQIQLVLTSQENINLFPKVSH